MARRQLLSWTPRQPADNGWRDGQMEGRRDGTAEEWREDTERMGGGRDEKVEGKER